MTHWRKRYTSHDYMPPRVTWSIILSGFAFWFILIDAYFRWT